MPWKQCPTCQAWAQPAEWESADGQRIPFRIRCPHCGAEHDVAEPPYRLQEPDDE